jgi:hypothetical protein
MKLNRLVSLLTVAGMLLGLMVVTGVASSHREAPLISNDPQVDNTDLYAFIDPAAPGMLNIVSVYYPFELPAGFPNGFTFSDTALYTINIDRTGDGRADLRYGFQFQTRINQPDTFYSNVTLQGDLAITGAGDPDENIQQTYSVYATNSSRLPVPARGSTVSTLLSDAFTSPNNVGPTTHAGTAFETIMASAVYAAQGGINVWAGQVDDPFFADLGAIWDFAQLRSPGIDALADMNAQAIVMQVPVASVIGSDSALTGPDDPRAAVGIWAANYRPAITTLSERSTRNHGPYVQVSRLGMPLSNEVIILLRDKDRWNRTEPARDAQFLAYYENSHLAFLLNTLFGTPGGTANRDDLVTLFLTGIPGLTQVADTSAKAVKSDMLRINLAVPDSQFPNGRDLDDDVIDVSLSVVGLNPCQPDPSCAGEGNRVIFGQPGYTTAGISDGVDGNDVPFMTVFPWVPAPHSGFTYNPESGGD